MQKAASAIVGLVLHTDNLEEAVKVCCETAVSTDENLRGNAILCFGHLARRFCKLDRDKVEQFIKSGLNDPNEYVRAQAHSAVDDVKTFLGWEITGIGKGIKKLSDS